VPIQIVRPETVGDEQQCLARFVEDRRAKGPPQLRDKIPAVVLVERREERTNACAGWWNARNTELLAELGFVVEVPV
jgi:hypothetical protein